MSWKQKAIHECKRHDIELEDRSTLEEYVIVLRTIYYDRVILFAEEREHIIRMDRFKGSNKAKIWEEVYDTVMGGTVLYQDWHDHMTNCRDACICQPYYPLAYYPEEEKE